MKRLRSELLAVWHAGMIFLIKKELVVAWKVTACWFLTSCKARIGLLTPVLPPAVPSGSRVYFGGTLLPRGCPADSILEGLNCWYVLSLLLPAPPGQ